MKRVIFLIFLFGLAVTERVFFDLGPNIELVTMALILSLIYIGKKEALILVTLILITSDLFIGNSSIALFTWSGFLLPIMLLGILHKTRGNKAFVAGTIAGVGANLFFYLWTNFGVWYLDSWGMYANDMGGLMLSYANALPFLRLQLTSTLIFVPIGIMAVEVARLTRKATFPQSKVLPQFLTRDL